MAQEAIARPARLLAGAREHLAATGVPWAAIAASRALVWAVAAAASAWLARSANADRFDAPGLTQPFGELGDALLAPLARWDAVWYLRIADSGYGAAGPDEAFFPLYPLLVRAFAPGGSPEALLVSATAVSLAAFAGALCVVHRLAEIEAGPRAARWTVLALALFPGSLWFGAPYSESVYLLLSAGAVLAARSGRWAWAGALAGLASATRSAGLVLVLVLGVMYLWGPRADRPSPARAAAGGLARRLRPRHPLRADAAWLALAPAGAALYSLWLWAAHGDPLAWMAVQEAWYREAGAPFAGLLDGGIAAWDGLRQVLSGQSQVIYWERAGGDPLEAARRNLVDFAFLAVALAALAGVARRLPAAYTVLVVGALALPLSFPVGPQPLMSLPRFVAVLFPLFMWAGIALAERPRLRGPALAASAAALCGLTTWFATWEWVA